MAMAKTISDSVTNLVTSIKKLQARTHAEVVLVSAAMLEEQVRRVLLTRMRKLSGEMHKRLFDGYGPLGSFSGKIDLAFALQAISKEVYDDLTVIRKIRNKFAHSAAEVNLDSAEIQVFFMEFKSLDKKETDYRAVYLAKLVEIDGHLDRVINEQPNGSVLTH